MLWDWIKHKLKRFFSSFKKTKVKALYEEDLFELLDKEELYDKLTSGEASCGVCGNKISIDNLSAIIKNKTSFVLICGRPNCLTQIK